MSEVTLTDVPSAAAGLIAASRPRRHDGHLLDTTFGPHLLVADGSRLFAIGEAARDLFLGEDGAGLVEQLGLELPLAIDDRPIAAPPLRSLSLSVAQACNLGCGYCYAQGGSFGREPQRMELPVALAAVDRLVADAAPGERISLAFLGGEPLIARDLIRATTEHAVSAVAAKGARASFSITTNGTLLREDDARFFERHGFSVTVSIDGVGEAHDRLRPFRDGRGSFARVIERVAPLLARQQAMQVSARVTVTPDNLDLVATLDELAARGFHSVGFSPMLRAPGGRHELARDDVERLLAAMVACGDAFVRHTLAGRRYPFANLLTALRNIHRGTHRPYPCGAGAGYAGVSAEGRLFACHRFVEDEAGAMGDLAHGIDPARQRAWLDERHVDRQEPCRSCWARYLCGGGCHHEVIARGRPVCDYIRGWLHYCLTTYVELSERRPDLFAAAAP